MGRFTNLGYIEFLYAFSFSYVMALWWPTFRAETNGHLKYNYNATCWVWMMILIYIQYFFPEYIGCPLSFFITQIPLINWHSSVLSTWIQRLYIVSRETTYVLLNFHFILKFHKMSFQKDNRRRLVADNVLNKCIQYEVTMYVFCKLWHVKGPEGKTLCTPLFHPLNLKTVMSRSCQGVLCKKGKRPFPGGIT